MTLRQMISGGLPSGVVGKLVAYVASGATLSVVPVIQLGIFLLTARSLEAHNFGAYIALTSTVGLLMELVALGAGDRMVRAIASDHAQRPSAMAHFVWLTLATWPAVLLLHVGLQKLWISPEASLTLILAAAIFELPLGRLVVGVEQVAIATGEINFANIIRILTMLARFVSFALFFALGALGTVEGVLFAGVTGAVASAATAGGLAVHRYGWPKGGLCRAEVGPGIALALVQFVRSFQYNADRVILSTIVGPSSLAVYASGMRIVQAAYIPLQVFLRIVYPEYYRANARGGLDAVVRYGVKLLPAVVAIGAGIGICLTVLAPLVRLALGDAYAGASNVILAGGWIWLVFGIGYVAGDVLVGADCPGVRSVVALSAAALQAVCIWLFAQSAGVFGAVVALYVASAAAAAVSWGWVLIRLRARPALSALGGRA